MHWHITERKHQVWLQCSFNMSQQVKFGGFHVLKRDNLWLVAIWCKKIRNLNFRCPFTSKCHQVGSWIYIHLALRKPKPEMWAEVVSVQTMESLHTGSHIREVCADREVQFLRLKALHWEEFKGRQMQPLRFRTSCPRGRHLGFFDDLEPSKKSIWRKRKWPIEFNNVDIIIKLDKTMLVTDEQNRTSWSKYEREWSERN